MAVKLHISKELRSLVLQLLIVAFGVYLGLLGNQWADNRKMQRSLKSGLQSIANEVAFNKNFLTQRRDYYESVVGSLDSLIAKRGADAPIEDIPGFQGIRPILLRNSSYQLAQATQVLANMDYNLADEISMVYSVQDFQLKGVDKFLDGYIMGQTKDLASFRGMFQNFVTMCNEMIYFYNQAEPKLPKPM